MHRVMLARDVVVLDSKAMLTQAPRGYVWTPEDIRDFDISRTRTPCLPGLGINDVYVDDDENDGHALICVRPSHAQLQAETTLNGFFIEMTFL